MALTKASFDSFCPRILASRRYATRVMVGLRCGRDSEQVIDRLPVYNVMVAAHQSRRTEGQWSSTRAATGYLAAVKLLTHLLTSGQTRHSFRAGREGQAVRTHAPRSRILRRRCCPPIVIDVGVRVSPSAHLLCEGDVCSWGCHLTPTVRLWLGQGLARRKDRGAVRRGKG